MNHSARKLDEINARKPSSKDSHVAIFVGVKWLGIVIPGLILLHSGVKFGVCTRLRNSNMKITQTRKSKLTIIYSGDNHSDVIPSAGNSGQMAHGALVVFPYFSRMNQRNHKPLSSTFKIPRSMAAGRYMPC